MLPATVRGAEAVMEMDPHYRPAKLDRSPATDFHALVELGAGGEHLPGGKASDPLEMVCLRRGNQKETLKGHYSP